MRYLEIGDLHMTECCSGVNVNDCWMFGYRRLVKSCELLIPGHNLSAYVDRFAEDLIEYLESKKLLKTDDNNPEEHSNGSAQAKSHRALLYEHPTKVDISEAAFDLQEFVLQRMSVPACKPLVFAGEIIKTLPSTS